jgi:hypothetical protein
MDTAPELFLKEVIEFLGSSAHAINGAHNHGRLGTWARDRIDSGSTS